LQPSLGITLACLLGAFLALGTESQAHITRIEIERVESPTFDGTTSFTLADVDEVADAGVDVIYIQTSRWNRPEHLIDAGQRAGTVCDDDDNGATGA